MQNIEGLWFNIIHLKIMKMNSTYNKNTFYDYQEKDIESLFGHKKITTIQKLFYELPSAGGISVMFSEMNIL
jgi:hypothetical protein